MNTNGLTLKPCLEMSGQLANVANRATNRAKYPSSIVSASRAQRQNKQVETNKSNQRPPKISEAEQHQQRPRQPQQQHVRFSATSASASVVTKFRVPTPATLDSVSGYGKGPKILLLQCHYKEPARSKNYVPVQYHPSPNEELSWYPARPR